MADDEGWESRRKQRKNGFLTEELLIGCLVSLSAQEPHVASVAQQLVIAVMSVPTPSHWWRGASKGLE